MNESPNHTPAGRISGRIPRTRFHLVIAGGGTGGHLMPGIAIARRVRELAPGATVTFVTPGKKLERDILAQHGETPVLCGGRSPAGGPINKFLAGASLVAATWRCRALLRELEPDAVLGVGGYGSVCAGVAAWRADIPLFLQEQNVVAGRVNRLLSRFAESVYSQWPLMRALPGRAAVMVTGNPVRDAIYAGYRPEALRFFGLSPDRTTVLIMGGSQGARSLNRAVLGNLPVIALNAQQLQVIHLTGAADEAVARQRWAATGITHAVLPFAGDMGPLYAAADFVIARAGATTVSELTALAKPMALVPLASAADDHQCLNARFVAAKGAAVVCSERDLADPAMLAHLLRRMVLDRRKRGLLALNSRRLGRPNAATTIAASLLARFGVQVRATTAEETSQRRAA